MILFVFEGEDREPHIYKTIEKLYFPKKNDNIICSFGNNIYELYREMMDYGEDGDIVAIMKELHEGRKDSILSSIRRSEISEIFLFFDYDFHNSQLSVDEMNKRLEEMLKIFDDETSNGKLYINYPMIESIRYTKELPDDNYRDYRVSREECRDFKRLTHEFSYYDSFDHILFKDGEKPSKEKYLTIKDNWETLKKMNVKKANWMISGDHITPPSKNQINQMVIFDKQKSSYVYPYDAVAVLNSFPLFLFEYFK